MVNHRSLTAAIIDSREFLAARRRADTEVLAPAGTRIAFTGGTECNDHGRIWETLDKVLAKHPDMVLLHGGAPRGAERIAACWGDSRKILQVVFKPDWTRHRNAAPFKRNDAMLEALPVGVIASPAPASPPTWPTRRRSSASRSGASISRLRNPERAPRRRRFFPRGMIALYDHIQELRAELRGCYLTRRERAAVEHELATAVTEQAERDRAFEAAFAAGQAKETGAAA